VNNASNPQAVSDLSEHRAVFDVEDLPGLHLGNVQRQPKELRVGFADVDKARENKEVHKPVQPELANPIRVEFAFGRRPPGPGILPT
jgi:hypothetical protein